MEIVRGRVGLELLYPIWMQAVLLDDLLKTLVVRDRDGNGRVRTQTWPENDSVAICARILQDLRHFSAASLLKSRFDIFACGHLDFGGLRNLPKHALDVGCARRIGTYCKIPSYALGVDHGG